MSTQEFDQYYEDRKKKLAQLLAAGHEPYGARYEDVRCNGDIRSFAERLGVEPGQTDDTAAVRAAGRIMLRRVMGKLAFLTIRDWTGDIQIGISKAKVGDAGWDLVASSTSATSLASMACSAGPKQTRSPYGPSRCASSPRASARRRKSSTA